MTKKEISAWFDRRPTPTNRAQFEKLLFEFGNDLVNRSLRWKLKNKSEVNGLLIARRASYIEGSAESYEQWATYVDKNVLADRNMIRETLMRDFYCELYADDYVQKMAFPTSPWQFIKERYFPKILLRLFPVVWKIHRLTFRHDHRIIYPGYDGESFVYTEWALKNHVETIDNEKN